jgi:hypothetical protein
MGANLGADLGLNKILKIQEPRITSLGAAMAGPAKASVRPAEIADAEKRTAPSRRPPFFPIGRLSA